MRSVSLDRRYQVQKAARSLTLPLAGIVIATWFYRWIASKSEGLAVKIRGCFWPISSFA
jgi:hypothetical protein